MSFTSSNSAGISADRRTKPRNNTNFQDYFSEELWKSTYKDHTDTTINNTLYRVAAAAASVEETVELNKLWTENFYDMLSEFKVTAGGRIYANAGTEWGGTTLMNCFIPSVQVLTSVGPKQICDVEIGDYVLTHKGRYRRVVNTMCREYAGPVQRFQSNYITDDIVSTPEHPYYQGGGKWSRSVNTTSLALAFHTPESDEPQQPIILDLAEILGDKVSEGYVTVDEGTIQTRRDYIGGQGSIGIKTGAPVYRRIVVDEEFAYLLGRFVGDGCTFRNNAHPSFVVDAFNVAFNTTTEMSHAHNLVTLFTRCFGVTPNIITSQNNTTYVRKASLIVAETLRRLVGDGFDKKRIPSIIWSSAVSVQTSFLKGLYDADGFVTSSGALQIEMTNPELISEVQTLITLLNIPASRSKNRLFSGSSTSCEFRSLLSKHYNDGRLQFRPTKSPTTGPVYVEDCNVIVPTRIDEEYTGYVYNISVDEDESYVVNNVIVHNCFVSPRRQYDIDSLDNILHNLRNQSYTLKSEGGWGENFSYIRPRGAFIHGIGVETPGAIKYMEMFDKSSEIITSGSGKKSLNKKAKGKIRKGAMMGVLDCLGGNTPINTLFGKVPIKDLVGKTPYLYCTDGHGNVYVRQALLVWSKGVKKTIRVMFDNDDFIECTPEHEFMLSDGTYKKAEDLTVNDSLAALNKRLVNDYLSLSVTGSRKTIAEHNAVYEMKYGEYPTILFNKKRSPNNTVAHHVDHTKWNNHPDNINQMTLREHSIHHSEMLKEMQQERAARMKGTTWEGFYGEEKAEEIRTKYVKKRKGSTPWNKGMKFSVDNTNHKVVRVESCIEQEVFDISMPDYHNFVANGVFVHNCWHPDIIEFITAKQTPGRLTKFNVSVNCTDEFMRKVLDVKALKLAGVDEQTINLADVWHLRFPDTTHPEYKAKWDGNLQHWLDHGFPVNTYNTISVSWLWNLIMESTYNRAEPGVLFLDRANFFGPLNYLETIFATNPCGEQMLAAAGVCNLGSINLTQFINETRTGFDMVKLRKYVRFLVRFLDNINSISNSPLVEYTESMRKKRRIGCGIMGWGSALFMLKIRFGSEQAAKLRDEVMSTIAREAYVYSIDLAVEKGMFEYCIPEKHVKGAFVQSLELPTEYMDRLRTTGIRNSSLLSIQPTGNTSILANVVSGGLEPIFMPEYIRTVIVNQMPDHIADVCPKWVEGEWRETEMFKKTKEGDEEILRGIDNEGVVYKIDRNRGLTKEVLCEDYGVRYLKDVGEWDPNAEWAVTTDNMKVEDHVSDLTGFARWVDSAMSKTVNVPNKYPFDKFKDIYTDCYETGYIKGITTYRSGTMTTVLSAAEEKHADHSDEEIIKDDVQLPDSAPAVMKTLRAEGKKYYVTVVYHEDNSNRPFALFVKSNHHESNTTTSDAVDHLLKLARKKKIPKKHIDDVEDKIQSDNNANKVARTISLLLRHGVLIKNIVLTLDKIEGVFVGSFIFQIKKFLSSYIKDGDTVEDEVCGECKGKVVYQEGCKVCVNCGNSKCG